MQTRTMLYFLLECELLGGRAAFLSPSPAAHGTCLAAHTCYSCMGYQHVFYMMKTGLDQQTWIMPHTNHTQVTPSAALSALPRFISLNPYKNYMETIFIFCVETEAERKSNLPGHVIFMGASQVAQQWRLRLQCRRHRRRGFGSWVRKISWRKAWQPTPIFLSGESHGQRNLEGCKEGCKELDMTEGTQHTRPWILSGRTRIWHQVSWLHSLVCALIPKLYCLSPVKQEICSLRPSESENLDTRDYAQSVYVGKRGWAGRWALGVSHWNHCHRTHYLPDWPVFYLGVGYGWGLILRGLG